MNNAEANKLDSDNVLEVRAQDQAPQHQEDGADRDNCYALRRADRDSSRLKPLVDCAELPELAHSTEPEFGAQRNLVISTGCPHSGWDMALPSPTPGPAAATNSFRLRGSSIRSRYAVLCSLAAA